MKIYGIPVATPIDPVVVKKDIPGHLEVTVDENNVASHSAQEIDAHVAKGGSVVLNFTDSSASHGYACLWARTSALVIFLETYVSEGGVTQTFFFIDGDKNCTEEVVTFEVSGGKTFDHITITENADGSVTMENTFTDGTSETIVLAAGDKPDSVTYNGVAIPIEWAVSE